MRAGLFISHVRVVLFAYMTRSRGRDQMQIIHFHSYLWDWAKMTLRQRNGDIHMGKKWDKDAWLVFVSDSYDRVSVRMFVQWEILELISQRIAQLSATSRHLHHKAFWLLNADCKSGAKFSLMSYTTYVTTGNAWLNKCQTLRRHVQVLVLVCLWIEAHLCLIDHPLVSMKDLETVTDLTDRF